MKPDKNQMTFGDKFARPIKPGDDVREPLVWFQSLHLIRMLGVGNAEGNCIRQFTLRRGLNILWAEPEDPEESAGLYGDGFAGHATGKTLFCRILRHLLGEVNFGTKELQEHVKDTFRELWAVASIRLNGKTWLVGRPLAGTGADFAIENGNIESVLATSPTFSGFKKFTDELEAVCGSPLSDMHPGEAWRNLLPWIARDQEARFSTITAWRDSSSEADNPRTSVGAQHLILRAVLRLLEEGEFDIRQKIAAAEDQIKTWNSDLPVKRTVAARDIDRVRRTLKSVPRCSVDLADLNAAKAQVVSQRTIRQEGLEQFSTQPESEEVQGARRHVQLAFSAKAKAEDRIRILKVEIPAEKKRADDNLLTVDRIKKGGFTDSKRAADGMCPHSYLTAQKNKCVPKSPDDIDPTMVEIGVLEDQANALATTVQAKVDEKARLESQLDQLDADIARQQRALVATLAKFPSPATRIQKEITILEAAEEEIEDAIQSANDEKEWDRRILSAQNQVVGFKDKLAHLKHLADRRLKSFSDIFADIAQAVLGATITASADLGERSIHLHVKRNRELGGAAVESIKTLAFDLAAVVHSLEGNCDHPRFLIHDGPREADMARVIYERFFLYARRIEDAFAPDQATFQYILTTTTHPPSDMQEGSTWLLGEKLSGKTKEGRLLKEDF